jgi:DNA polymerase-4
MSKIIHIDMDCFYAAVEQRDRPELRGKPIAVGGRPESRGVVTTASYEARKFGVRSAQPMSMAVRLCPSLVVVPTNFSKYKNESRKVRSIFERFTTLIEPLSLDEAFLDVSDCSEFEGSATLIAQEIRRLIFSETGLTASAGIASNKFLAKVASDWNKPNGQKVIRPEEVAHFVKELPIEKILGVGKVTASRMHKMGLKTCGDLQTLSVSELTNHFGSWGVKLYDYSRGIDHRTVKTNQERKSLSVETTFREDLKNLSDIERELKELYADWLERLNRTGGHEKIKSAFVKVKYHDFTQTTHERTVSVLPLLETFRKLLAEVLEQRSDAIRLLGLGVRLESTRSSNRTSAQLRLW